MIISATGIKKPRKARKCDECHKSIVGPAVRLYGMADDMQEKPYVAYVHPSCLWYADKEYPCVRRALAMISDVKVTP